MRVEYTTDVTSHLCDSSAGSGRRHPWPGHVDAGPVRAVDIKAALLASRPVGRHTHCSFIYTQNLTSLFEQLFRSIFKTRHRVLSRCVLSVGPIHLQAIVATSCVYWRSPDSATIVKQVMATFFVAFRSFGVTTSPAHCKSLTFTTQATFFSASQSACLLYRLRDF
ncbi:hypothetical protein J1614_001023 [Plenodomus biglobosus]|nr:hypothetical protein J1614_001023 [Plenodomus biglobosus]